MRTRTWPPVLTLWCATAALILAGAEGQVGSVVTPGLDLPLVCRLGETCWVANYVDVDPTEAVRDFRCGARSYDGHDGIDFAIRDRAVMERGVPVVASAPGIVRRIRDGIEDIALTDQVSRTRIAGKECGNGVVVDHEGAWQTQYCHLRRGSIRVRAGQSVERGAELGLVGLSGQTEFPHVHLTVRHEGRVVDPFTGRLQSAGCRERARLGAAGAGGCDGGEERELWRADAHAAYEHVALYSAGFWNEKPDVDRIRAGHIQDGSLLPTSKALVLWVDIFGVQAGDGVRFLVHGPDGGVVLDKEERVDRTQARRFAYAGRRLQRSVWPSGVYSGDVTLTRTVDGARMQWTVTRTVAVR
jgi:Peptidase family M23